MSLFDGYYKPAMLVLQSVNHYKPFYCKTNDADRRLDRVIKKMLPDVPAGLIYSALRKGRIKVNGKKVKQSYRTSADDVIQVHESIFYQKTGSGAAPASSGAVEKLKKMTVLKTDNLLLLNKPAGMLTHGDESLADLLKDGLEGIEESLSFTPAPLHRLDRNTSGLIAAGLSLKGAAAFSKLMRERKIRKYYLGLCLGTLEKELVLKNQLVRRDKKSYIDESVQAEGPEAVTRVFPISGRNGFTLCLFRIDTGQTHQIRSQLSSAGFPLAGDSKYGGGCSNLRNYILHSYAFILTEGEEVCGFSSAKTDLPSFAMTGLVKLLGEEAAAAGVSNIRYL